MTAITQTVKARGLPLRANPYYLVAALGSAAGVKPEASAMVFLANSIAYSWIKGVDLFSLFSGGLSVASFATLFFTKPQENITKALGNLAQIQMIYKAYCLQFDALLDFHLRQENASLDTICSMNSAVGTVADNAATRLEKLLCEMEKDLRIAKATLAGELGFALCPRCWPPELVTADRDGRIDCPACGKITYEQAA